MTITWVDAAIVGIFLLTFLISYFQTFMESVLSLVNWFTSTGISFVFIETVLQLLQHPIPFADLRIATALLILFSLSFIAIKWPSYVLCRALQQNDISFIEQLFVCLLSMIKGSVIIVLIVLMTGLTQLPQRAAWQQAILLPYFQSAAWTVQHLLPADVAQHFNFYTLPEHYSS